MAKQLRLTIPATSGDQWWTIGELSNPVVACIIQRALLMTLLGVATEFLEIRWFSTFIQIKSIDFSTFSKVTTQALH